MVLGFEEVDAGAHFLLRVCQGQLFGQWTVTFILGCGDTRLACVLLLPGRVIILRLQVEQFAKIVLRTRLSHHSHILVVAVGLVEGPLR